MFKRYKSGQFLLCYLVNQTVFKTLCKTPCVWQTLCFPLIRTRSNTIKIGLKHMN